MIGIYRQIFSFIKECRTDLAIQKDSRTSHRLNATQNEGIHSCYHGFLNHKSQVHDLNRFSKTIQAQNWVTVFQKTFIG